MGFYTPTGEIREHLTFEKLPLEKDRKMHKYNVRNHVLGHDVGIIHWRGGWRQYVFQANPKTDMAKSCNMEVNDFIDKLMKEWKNGKKEKSR